MSTYFPDNWVVIRIAGDDPHYRVLAGWSGGYTTGDSWRLNSGITKVRETDHTYEFHGSTGSIYSCHKEAYCLRNNNAYIWDQLKERHGDKVHMMDKDTDWQSVNWIISPKEDEFDVESLDPDERTWYYDGDGTKVMKPSND